MKTEMKNTRTSAFAKTVAASLKKLDRLGAEWISKVRRIQKAT